VCVAWAGKIDAVFYVVAFSAFFYFLNRDYGNIATAWVRGMFPKETDFLFGPVEEL
jgi:hypothetical protein